MVYRTLLTAFVALFLTACSSNIPQLANNSNPAEHPILNQTKSIYADGMLRVYFAGETTELPSNLLIEASPLIQAAKHGKALGISAYTPSAGDVAKNSRLMKNRGVAVRQFLEANGVPETQIKFVKPAPTMAKNSELLNDNPVEIFIFDE